MSLPVRLEDEPQILPRNPLARPGPIPNIRLEALYIERVPSLVVRADSSSSSESAASSASCGPNDTSGACKKSSSGGSSSTLPILLGVLVPLGIALGVLLFLQRRHVRKLRQEDKNDKHKSLDFGLGLGETRQRPGKKNRQKIPEMSINEDTKSRREKGMSLDLGIPNPYLLPPELQQSRESLHSLSRSMNTGDDKYRATTFIPDDGSIRPPSSLRSPMDDSSIYTGSSSRKFQLESKQNLLRNAQDNPVGPPLRRSSTYSVQSASATSLPAGTRTMAQASNSNLLAPTATEPVRDSFVSTASSNGAVNALRASNNYLGQFISHGTDKADSPKKVPTATVTEIKAESPTEDIRAPPPAIVKDAPITPTIIYPENDFAPSISVEAPDTRQPRLPQLSFIDSQGNKQRTVELGEAPESVPDHSNSPVQHFNAPSADLNAGAEPTQSQLIHPNEHNSADEDDYYDDYEAYGSEGAQQEVFEDYQDYEDYLDYDPHRLTMGVRPLPPDDPTDNPEQRANRIRSFYKEYFDDTAPQNSAHNGSGGHPDQRGLHPAQRQPRGMPPGRHRATVSNGSHMSGARAYSSASGRYEGRPPPTPKLKFMPPPMPLNLLPTPHLLKGDHILPMDFAPPQRIQAQRAGTPDSPLGGVRPYSPALRAHVPLVSSFDDLAVLPSPHALRKSSTFTSLDFAPPRGPMGVDTMSETGSIRSNRSGVSAMHLHNIRKGAYRVSRIPREVAGTKDELASALKPQWNLNR